MTHDEEFRWRELLKYTERERDEARAQRNAAVKMAHDADEENARLRAALKTIDRVLEQEAGMYPVAVIHADGTTHHRTEREEGENAATKRLTAAIWKILSPFYKDGTVPDLEDDN